MKKGNLMMNSNIEKGLLNMGQKKSVKSQTWSLFVETLKLSLPAFLALALQFENVLVLLKILFVSTLSCGICCLFFGKKTSKYRLVLLPETFWVNFVFVVAVICFLFGIMSVPIEFENELMLGFILISIFLVVFNFSATLKGKDVYFEKENGDGERASKRGCLKIHSLSFRGKDKLYECKTWSLFFETLKIVSPALFLFSVFFQRGASLFLFGLLFAALSMGAVFFLSVVRQEKSFHITPLYVTDLVLDVSFGLTICLLQAASKGTGMSDEVNFSHIAVILMLFLLFAKKIQNKQVKKSEKPC